MKVELDKLTVTTVEAEIPDKCPKCGASFFEEESLRENQYTASNQNCNMVEGEARLDEYGSSDEIYDCQYVVGYQCANCHHVLVSTEGEPTKTTEVGAVGADEFEEHLEQAALSDDDPNKRD